MDNKPRIFSEQQAADLILKAAKLQEEAPVDEGGYVPGLTLEELKRMAKELGVEEAYLLQALNSVEQHTESQKTKKFLGIEWGSEYDYVLEGELDPQNFDVVAEELSPNNFKLPAHHRGGTVQVGRSLTGTVTEGLGYATMKMTSRKGRTRLNFKTNAWLPFFATLYPAFIISFVAIGSAAENGGLAIAVPIVAAALGIAGGIFAKVQNTVSKKMRRRTAEIAQKIQEEIDPLRDELARPVTEQQGLEERANLLQNE